MGKEIIIKTPVKTIISGEQAVVHGAPAIVAAADLYNQIQIRARNSDDFLVSINERKFKFGYDEALSCANKARETWAAFKSGNLKRPLNLKASDGPKVVVGETLRYFKDSKRGGAEIEIKTKVAPGSGLGHSASIAAGTAKAIFQLNGKKYDSGVLREIVMECERRFHGNPSGVDAEAVLFGGLNWFRNRKRRIIRKLRLDKKIDNRFFLINTGKPSSTTMQAVQKASTFFRKRKESLLDFEHCTKNVARALKSGKMESLIKYLNLNQKLLSEIGVSSASADLLSASIAEMGGGCKITGAGTASGSNVGMMLAVHQDFGKLARFLRERKLEVYSVRLNVPGME